jgi:hypothetical protein
VGVVVAVSARPSGWQQPRHAGRTLLHRQTKGQ